MKLLTRYPGGSPSLSVISCLVKDASSTPAPKQASFLVRLPYYIFLVGLGAMYYGYVISLNIEWLIIHEGHLWIPLIFLSIFHFLFGMFMWSLLATAYRGPGLVGETLTSSSQKGGAETVDLEAGMANEAAPLMQNFEGSSSHDRARSKGLADVPNDYSKQSRPQWRRRSSSSRGRSSSEEEETANDDYLELQPKNDYGDSSSDEDEGDGSDAHPTASNSKHAKKTKKETEIVYTGSMGSSSLMAKANGKARYCRKCNLPKPDRAHHCSTCGFCVLKMDHHCPWIGGCVGFKNYKQFILFLLYGCLASIFGCVTTIWALIQVLERDVEELGLAPVGWGFLVLFSFLFAVMLAGFFPYHLYLAVNNRSTIENMERNGRLLSLPARAETLLPARAETLLAAGVTDPQSASLPERPKPGAGLEFISTQSTAPGYAQPPAPGFQDAPSAYRPTSQNPFLPSSATASATGQTSNSSNSNNTGGGGTSQRNNTTFESSALQSLSRMQKRELERKAGRINIYDLGTWQANFRETFGANWNSIYAWLPIGKSEGSGYDWPVNRRAFEKLHSINAQLRTPSSGI